MCVCVCVFLPLLADCQPASAVCGGVVGPVVAVVVVLEQVGEVEHGFGSSQGSPHSSPAGDRLHHQHLSSTHYYPPRLTFI